MISQALLDTVGALLADRNGLLAMDESNGTCNARFARLGIAETESCRTFSFSRAIQQSALELWRGQEENVLRGQQALLQQAENNRLARRGEYEGEGPGHGAR